MVRALLDIRSKALRLAPKERARLASALLTSLPIDEEPLTIDEVSRRADDLASGRVKGIPAKDVHASLRRRIAKKSGA